MGMRMLDLIHFGRAVATSVAVVPVGVFQPVVLTAAAVVAVGVVPPVVSVGVVPPVVLAVPPLVLIAIKALLRFGIAFCDACSLFHQLSHATQHAGNEAQGRRPFVQPLPWSLCCCYHQEQIRNALIPMLRVFMFSDNTC